MRKLGILGLLLLAGLLCAYGGFWWAKRQSGDTTFPSPFISQPEPSPKPLLAYTIPALSQRQYQASHLTIESMLADEDTYTSYVFSYSTQGKKMTGQLNVPHPARTRAKAIVMLRGYVPLGIFETGVGTKNAARVYAEHGYITVAPDFLGYGGSDPEPEDGWQARFEKPISVVELIKTLEAKPLVIPAEISPDQTTTSITVENIGLWGHSNGGQIALTTLEILQQPIPTTLWAPVTVPFPYSILFFTDENEDEGKGMRKWLSFFENDYDVFDFTLTKHLDKLRAPLQLHHGTADEAALKVWSDEFVAKIESENKRRESEAELQATTSASTPDNLKPIDMTYYVYPGADHNLQPGWSTVVERDLVFFDKLL